MERDDLEYVGFWPRVGAELIDFALLVCIVWPALIAYYGESKLFSDDGALIRGPLDLVLSWIMPGVLTVGFWVWKQATPGKMAIGAKIVDATSGRCPTVGQFVGRYLVGYVSFFALGLGFFWVLFNPRKQGWHDLAANTVVVRPKHRPQAAVTFGN